MLKFFFIILFLAGCKKRQNISTSEFHSEITLPTCDDDPMYCDDDLEDLPEANSDIPEDKK